MFLGRSSEDIQQGQKVMSNYHIRYVNFELLTYTCISYGCRLFMQCKVKGHNVLLELTACFIEGAVAI